MKKLLFSLAAVAAMATGGFLGYSSGDSDSKLSSVMMANIEALAGSEGSIEIWYDKACLSGGNDVCATSSSEIHYNSTPYNY